MIKEKDKDVLTTMPLSEMGEIELPDLDKLNIGEVYQAKADQSDVQRVIDQYLYENMKEVDEPASENGYVNVNVTGTVDGEQNDRYTIQETTLKIGSGDIFGNVEAENQLLGKKAGEDISVEYVPTEETAIMPQDIGKTISLTAHINWVGKIPELTDEFVSQQGEFTTVDEFTADMTEKVNKSYDAMNKNTLYSNTVEYIRDNAQINISDKLFELEQESVRKNLEQFAKDAGTDFDTYLKTNLGFQDRDDLRSYLCMEAISQAETLFVNAKLQDVLGVEVNDELRHDYIDMVATSNRTTIDYDEYVNLYGAERLDTDVLRYGLGKALEGKVIFTEYDPHNVQDYYHIEESKASADTESSAN